MSSSPTIARSRMAFLAITLAFVINMVGTTLPTAIYPFYRDHYGFSPLVITVIFACYAVGVLGALLVAGNWSDQLGRRPMLGAGLASAAFSAVIFVFSHGLTGLLFGRFLSGISAGIFTGTATVAVIELAPSAWKKHATLVATAANMLGLGLGPLLAGVLVGLLPWPMRLPFLVHLSLLLLAALAVYLAPETVKRSGPVELGLQRLSLPEQVRGVFVPAAIAGFAGFMVVGFFTAIVSELISQVLHYHNSILIGAIVFLIFACSAIGQVLQQFLKASWRQPLGCLALIFGLIVIAVCVWQQSMTLLLIGTVLAGLGQGVSFRAGLGEISSYSPEDRRAEITSSFFVVLYVAISLPVIGVGLLTNVVGIRNATLIFSALTALLVAAALVLLLYRQRDSASNPLIEQGSLH